MAVLGVDISKWQTNFDWIKCSKTSAKFAFVRAGSVDNITGKCYTDYQFPRNSEIAPELMPTSYYWYYRPNWSVDMQADYFSELLYNVKRQMPPVYDVEAPPDTWRGMTFSPFEYANLVAEFIRIVMSNLSIKKTIIYSRQSYWDRFIEHRDAWSLHDLWIARYAPLSSPWADGKFKPRDWNNWTFWQFTDKGIGETFGTTPESLQIDLNYFNGTEEDLHRYAGVYIDPKDRWMAEIDAWARLNGYTGVTPTGE